VAFDQLYKAEIDILIKQGLDPEKAKKEAPILLKAQDMLLAWEQGDQVVMDLWKTMNTWVFAGFEKSYAQMGVRFDKIYRESNTYLLGKKLVDEGLKEGVFYQKEDQSVWINLEDEGLDEKLVLRKDGTSVYITQDMGTAQLKFEDFGAKKSIYVVGNEQDYHFEVLFHILKKLNKPYSHGNFHLSYGMVDLPSGKMKSREGTVVDADDLMAEMVQTAKERTMELGKTDGFTEDASNELYQQLGMGALKYFLLKVDPKKRMMFNPEESIDFQGNTGPFIQYTHARICSITRKSKELGIDLMDTHANNTELSVTEIPHPLLLQPQFVPALFSFHH
jgi:arginyl-tRNA synthetase